MKRQVPILLLLLFWMGSVAAQVKFVDAAQLTLINKLTATKNPYERIDTDRYDLTEAETLRFRFSAGLALVFETNSTRIDVRTDYLDYRSNYNMSRITTAGYDLYIYRDGEWLYANSGVAAKGRDLQLISGMDRSMKRCLLYLPLWSRISSISIGVDEDATIAASENPFRHRILIIGSSYTHGDGTSRSGMSYPMQLERSTGLQFINLGVSGQSKLQPAFAEIVCDNTCDALVLDAFSNPSPQQIHDRVIPFITRVREVHPHLPIIFLRTIYRERRNFDMGLQAAEERKDSTAVAMMKLATERFDDVYFIDERNQTGTDHITSVDGVHPGDFGYWRWANTIRPHLLRILKRYDIR